MFYDPYTIVVVPTSHGQAEGVLYLDDEQSLAHEISDAFALRALSFTNNILTCKAATASETKGGGGIYDPPNTVERIIIAGQSVSPSKVLLSSSSSSSSSSSTSVEGEATVQKELSFVYDKEKRTVTIKKPDTKVAQDWTIALF
jgi:alpha 1,3-glucosidase